MFYNMRARDYSVTLFLEECNHSFYIILIALNYIIFIAK